LDKNAVLNLYHSWFRNWFCRRRTATAFEHHLHC